MRPQRAIQMGRYREGFPIRLRSMFLFYCDAEVSKRLDMDQEQGAYEGTCVTIYPTKKILRIVANWFPVRPSPSSNPRKRAALGRRFSALVPIATILGWPTPTSRCFYRSARSQYLNTPQNSSQRITHIVEDIDDNQDGHPSVQLEQQPPFQLLPRLSATEFSIWIRSGLGIFPVVFRDI